MTSSDDAVDVLLVDDQPGKLLAYEVILGELGERLHMAQSAREALELLLSHDIAVLIVDVCMPELDGFELVEIIHEHPRFHETAVIFASAVHITDTDRLRGYRAGAVDYVSVPIVPEILRSKVRVLADLHRKTRQLAELNRGLEQRVMERTAQLRASQDRLGLALDSAGAASWDLDATSGKLDWTPRFLELYGLDERDPPTLETVLSRVVVEDRERLASRVREILTTPGDDVWSEEFRIAHPQSGARMISGLGRALRDTSGQVVRMTGIDLDITDRSEAEQSLREGARRKDEFIATLSHELRNPLAPLKTAAHLLGQPKMTDEQRLSIHGVIERQVEHMTRLVDDLLDVSRITSGKIVLRRAPVTVHDVLTRALEASRPLFDERRIAVQVVETGQDLLIDGDLARLVQVLANLLHNSAKYTDFGGRVALEARRDRSEIVLSVQDNGVGIAPDVLPHVFDLFTQGAGDRSADGLGIGLSISRRLVEMHGGSLTAASEGPGRGSQFSIRLPLHTPSPAVEERREEPRGFSRRRILIADDNADCVEMLALVLRGLGHEVHTAADGVEAVEAADVVRPEVVLLDVGMPRLDGYSAARWIRKQPWGDDVVLIAQTGWGQPDDRRRAFEAGFDEHLTKPVDVGRLERALGTLHRRPTPPG